jgi:hypothetical protein
VQIHIQKLAGAIGRAFFRDWRPEPIMPMQTELPSSQTQSQSQGPPEALA